MSNDVPRIIVVEDDASMSQALKRILLAGGFKVDTFSCAEDALEAEAKLVADCLSSRHSSSGHVGL